MKKYIVILAALALAIGGSINLTGCGKPAAAPDNRPDPIPAPGYTGPDEPDVLPEGATPIEGSKPAEKE
jgi:hypothetical protein